MRKKRNKVSGADVLVKGCLQFFVSFKIEIRHVFIVVTPKFKDRICFAYLPCSLNDKGFSVRTVFPFLKKMCYFSIHDFALLSGHADSITHSRVNIKGYIKLFRIITHDIFILSIVI